MLSLLVLVAFVVGVYFVVRTRRSSDSARPSLRSKTTNVRETPIASGIVLRTQVVRPDAEAWARERDDARRARDAAIQRMRSAFPRPQKFSDATVAVVSGITQLAQTLGCQPPDYARVRQEIAVAGDPRKTEKVIRKRLGEAYKLRGDPTSLCVALALCVMHIDLAVQHSEESWKVASSIKRLARNLDHEHYRSTCIGFLLATASAVQSAHAELARACEEEVERLFRAWHSDQEANAGFQDDLRRIDEAGTASDQHFVLNRLIEYLDRRRRFDPSVRYQLIRLSERDVALYKPFLSEFTRLEGKRPSFEEALGSEHYLCPRLPSFDALWDLYEEEGNLTELGRLRKIAGEIKYRHGDIGELASEPSPTHTAATSQRAVVKGLDESFPTETIDVPRSGQKGKLAYLDRGGKACSTEAAAQDYLRRQGFKVLRGEVQFWQAMFGLAFWEEIFDGTGAPNDLNDIPPDLFSGSQFYETRRFRIEEKAARIARGDVRMFIRSQLQRYGSTWTRIVYDGPRGFAYREFLESADVTDFLATISSAVFARIVQRIAMNPNENRAGLPDYVIWKDGTVTFVEVKGIREKIRDAQVAWLAWMNMEGIPARIIRVRGIADRSEAMD